MNNQLNTHSDQWYDPSIKMSRAIIRGDGFTVGNGKNLVISTKYQYKSNIESQYTALQ